ncbi:hypothetical protein ABPG74_012803 [Tetrahymena malaccensis]
MDQQDQDIGSQINQQVEGKNIKDVEDIYLQNILSARFTSECREKIQSFPNLICFSLTNMNFNKIQDLPILKRLLRLEICYCTFDISSLNQIYIQFPRLVSLRLVGCNISSYSQIECLTSLPDLAQLDLFNNPIYKFNYEYQSFHQKMFELFPKLMYLDNLKKDFSRACTIPINQIDPKQLIQEVEIPKFADKLNRSNITSQNNSFNSNKLTRKNNTINPNKRRAENSDEDDDDLDEDYQEDSDGPQNQRHSYQTRKQQKISSYK